MTCYYRDKRLLIWIILGLVEEIRLFVQVLRGLSLIFYSFHCSGPSLSSSSGESRKYIFYDPSNLSFKLPYKDHHFCVRGIGNLAKAKLCPEL